MKRFSKSAGLVLAAAVGLVGLASGTAQATEYLLVSNGGLNQPTTSVILKYNATTGAFIGNFVDPGNGLDGPRGLAFGPDGNLYVANNAGNDVLEYNGSTGAFVKQFVTPASGGLNNPEDLAFHNGELYVSGFLSNNVLKYNAATGAFDGVFVAPTADTAGADGFTFDQQGNLLLTASQGPGKVLKYDSNGNLISTFAAGFGLHGPRDIALDSQGNAYVTTGSNIPLSNGSSVFPVDSVEKFDPNGNDLGPFVAEGSGGLSTPRHLEFGPNGDLFVVSQDTNSILEYSSLTGAFDTVFATGGGLNRPTYFLFHDVVPPPTNVPLPTAAASGLGMLTALGAISRMFRRRKA